jgi:hypothetical protein
MAIDSRAVACTAISFVLADIHGHTRSEDRQKLIHVWPPFVSSAARARFHNVSAPLLGNLYAS